MRYSWKCPECGGVCGHRTGCPEQEEESDMNATMEIDELEHETGEELERELPVMPVKTNTL
jgi:hypothetical protein